MAEVKWAIGGSKLWIRQAPVARISLLRVRKPTQALLDSYAAVLGHALPQGINMAVGIDPRIMSLAPHDWMIVGDAQPPLNTVDTGASLCHAADVTEGRTLFEIGGGLARSLLAKGTSIDLHPRSFCAGQCAQTLFAQTRLLIECVSDAPLFNVYADRSYTSHMIDWFEDAIKEFN
ncbi:sarcosine oxidase subunit gamma [Sphingobium sp. AP50]|uniref:sarcosine oxidase subunit gamma n=1 Tax=Sphingobium sp. AP50 TaxID=1884369 RepID=UPI0008AE275C|nr:sarcosine oxidase subunit gamma family protein [Sphingobium sp. AP50]SEJ98705.1 sarcosine oxidase subunit gamma [Sphingobium sp. AP50]